MTALGSLRPFACEACGSPSISVPATIHAAADLACAGCGVRVSSWSEFKERARQVILSEIASGKVSADLSNSDILVTDLAPAVR
ncbi:hypothetical protein [Microvirga sp. VF16]|uniref:hypothetical protein n=1 Tax=Microvirga sp. VF16 TaxID=2807101 RepID=UPI00193D96E2|nr:hypothetical protein [Microvirga sp. VF16]QRM35641.1 hypothetical protein JO965_43230 [Microvirga sp. VF16]